MSLIWGLCPMSSVFSDISHHRQQADRYTLSLEAHISSLKKGLENADIILTTGGTSMGASDLLKPVIERHLGGVVHFGRVKTKPGKPTTFATIPRPGDAERQIPVFALPGNPASALVTFHIFAVPALRKLGGWPIERCQLPRIKVEVSRVKSRFFPPTRLTRHVSATSCRIRCPLILALSSTES